MINIAICDDDDVFCSYEKEMIMDYMNERNVEFSIKTFTSGKELLESRDDIFSYHVIFLDVEMDVIDGIETARQIRKLSKDAFLVFVTAFITYSLEGYKVDAIRFLVKEKENLAVNIKEALDAIMREMKHVEWKLCLNFVEGKRLVKAKDIEYIESNLHRVIFYIRENESKRYTLYDKLDSVAKQFDDIWFCRIHKSFLVNLNYVKTIRNNNVILDNGKVLSIAKSNRYEVMNQYIAYRGGI